MVTELTNNKPIENRPGQPGNTIGNRWQPGESGNPGGKPKYKPITDRLIALLEKDGGANADAIAKAFIEVLKTPAGRGYAAQIRELLDRTEGKVKSELGVEITEKVEVIEKVKDYG